MQRNLIVTCAAALVLTGSREAAIAGGLLPERVNKVRIEGQFARSEPRFVLVFSAQPWRDRKNRLLNEITDQELATLSQSDSLVALKVHGKPVSAKGVVEYFFGPKEDGQQPWNDGRGMNWKEWEKRSPDVWDNLAIIHDGPDAKASPTALLNCVAVIKGGKTLFDSAAKRSYPNKRPMDPSIQPIELASKQQRRPVLNLAERMERFRRDHYELGNNSILLLAYADLGQTDKNKYARRGKSWCSEFASHVYRENGLMTPDPNKNDVHWKSMRQFFATNGKVYSLREVARWPDSKKRSLIKPGSFVSILNGESTHSIIFTAWMIEKGKPITRYVGVSGNNKGMVWPHAPLELPTADQFKGKSADELQNYDQKVYFGVPNDIGLSKTK